MFYIPREDEEEVWLKNDSEYSFVDSKFTNLILQQTITHSLDVLSKVKFDTIGDYDRYNRLFVNLLPSFYNDVQIYTSHIQQIENMYVLDPPSPELDLPTNILDESKTIISELSHIIPQAKGYLTMDEFDDFKESLAGYTWIASNVVRMDQYPGEYDSEVVKQIADVLNRVDALNYFYNRYMKGEIGIIEPNNYQGILINSPLHSNNLKRIPPLLVFFANFVTFYPIIGRILESVNRGVVQATSQFVSVASQLGDWGNPLKNPISAMMNVAHGMVGITLAGMGLLSSVYSIGSTLLIPAFKSLEDNPYEENKDKTMGDLFFKTLTTALGSIMSMAKGIFNVFINTIKMGFQMFFNIITSIIKTLQSIAETSPVLQTILDYVFLAVNLVFLPFFTSFGEPLLGYIMEFVTFFMILGMKLSSFFQENDTKLDEHLSKTLSEIKRFIKKAIKIISEDIMEEGLDKLMKPVLDFVKSFMNTIIENSSKIDDFLDKGINAMNVLLTSGIIKTVLELSTQVFQWVIDNKEFIGGLFDFVDGFINLGLRFVGWALNNIELATIAILTAVGTACGAIGGLQAGMAAAWFTFGLSVPAATAVGASLGASAGLASALYILYEWITPAKQEVESLLSDVPKYGSGGKIYGRRGGHIGLLGEVGQGEYAIPESKVDLFRGNNNIIVKFKKGVYNQRAVDDVMSELKQELIFDNLFY